MKIDGAQNLACQWCGESGPPDDFECDEVHNAGFWCPGCDGFTAYAAEANDKHRILLLLETGVPDCTEIIPPSKTSLRKQLSPLRYPGGKSKMIDSIYHRLQYDMMDTFIEVFAGGASLGLSLLDAGKIKRLVLNDYDPHVFAFWHTALTNHTYLTDRIMAGLPTMDDFWSAKEVCARQVAAPEEEQAWAFFLLNRTCFSGIVMANPIGGRGGTDEQLRARWNPKTLCKRLDRVAEMAPLIDLRQMDCVELLEAYGYWYKDATLFVDPPYVDKGAALYPTAFTEDDHRRLAWMIESLHTGMPGPDIIITYDDCPLVRELYPLAQVEPITRWYSIAN